MPSTEANQQSSPILSIVIPAYNVEAFIIQAVMSALSQGLQDLEVLVIDDGSTDRTAALVGKIQDPRLRLIRQENRGLSGARNTGIRNARGRFIGFLDGDDEWLPEKAESQVAIMEADPTIGITFSHSRYIDENGAETGRVLFSRIESPTIEEMIRRNRIGNGSSPVVRAECFEQAGLFDESLRSCEDWEMWIRILRETKLRFQLVPEFLTYYRINTRSLSMNFEGFLNNAERAVDKVAADTPGVSCRVLREGRATMYRIASTKALFNGQRTEASRLMVRAVLLCPWMVLFDPRMVATLVLLTIPNRLSGSAKSAAGRLFRPVPGRVFKASAKTVNEPVPKLPTKPLNMASTAKAVSQPLRRVS